MNCTTVNVKFRKVNLYFYCIIYYSSTKPITLHGV